MLNKKKKKHAWLFPLAKGSKKKKKRKAQICESEHRVSACVCAPVRRTSVRSAKRYTHAQDPDKLVAPPRQMQNFEGKKGQAATTPATSTWCYGPVPRFEEGSQEPASVALLRCRTAHGIGKQVKGRVVLGRPGTRSVSALPY